VSSSNTNGIWRWVRHWGVICVLGSVLYLFLFLFGQGVRHDKTIDLQLHDTYFIIGIFQATVYIVVTLYCIIAFGYQFIAGWENHVLNVTQTGFTAIVLSFYYLLWIFGWQYLKNIFENSPNQSGWTIYPPLSALQLEIPEPTIPWMSWLAITLLIVLPIVYLVYCIYRTVKNYRIS
jgi:heme/copper-type cytochrome/quinol oxidase subunit 1